MSVEKEKDLPKIAETTENDPDGRVEVLRQTEPERIGSEVLDIVGVRDPSDTQQDAERQKLLEALPQELKDVLNIIRGITLEDVLSEDNLASSLTDGHIDGRIRTLSTGANRRIMVPVTEKARQAIQRVMPRKDVGRGVYGDQKPMQPGSIELITYPDTESWDVNDPVTTDRPSIWKNDFLGLDRDRKKTEFLSAGDNMAIDINLAPGNEEEFSEETLNEFIETVESTLIQANALTIQNEKEKREEERKIKEKRQAEINDDKAVRDVFDQIARSSSASHALTVKAREQANSARMGAPGRR